MIVECAVAILGVLGAAAALPPRALPGAPTTLTFALKSLAIAALAIGALAEEGAPAPGLTRLRRALARFWPCFLPLALFLFVFLFMFLFAPQGRQDDRTLRLTLASVATIAALVAARRSQRDPDHRDASVRSWGAALLITAACICVAYTVVGTTAAGSTDNDPAYYYGVARHIVLTYRYEEPIVWHFLTHPAQVLHAPFDYWSGFTSLCLIPFLALFGATHRVAGAAMGLYTGLSVLAFAWLIGVAAPLRSRVLQVVALLLFAFSPALMRFRFDTETIPFVHLWTILALVALARRRSALAVLCAFVMFWARPEDVVLAIIVSAVALAQADQGPNRRRDLTRTILAGVLCSAAYVGYHLILFQTPLPPGTLIGRRLSDYGALYRWTDAPPSTWHLGDHFAPAYISGHLEAALSGLQEITFFVNYPLWMGLALIHGCRWHRSSRPSLEGVSWLLMFGGAFMIGWANPTMFASQRSLHALLPVFVLAGAYGAEAIGTALDRLPPNSFPRAAPAWLVRPLPALLIAAAMLLPLKMRLTPGTPLPFSADMAALDSTLAAGTVMSQRPWSIIAETRSPAVSIPQNGEGAIEAVLRRYHVRWLLLVRDDCGGASQPICRDLLNGSRRNVGAATVTKRLTRGELTLFDVRL